MGCSEGVGDVQYYNRLLTLLYPPSVPEKVIHIKVSSTTLCTSA